MKLAEILLDAHMADPSKQQGRCAQPRAASLDARSAGHMEPTVKETGQQRAGQQLLGSRSVTQPLQAVRHRKKGFQDGGTNSYAGASRIGRLDAENSSSLFNSHSRHAGVCPLHVESSLPVSVVILAISQMTPCKMCA